jgi:hypothetical protein
MKNAESLAQRLLSLKREKHASHDQSSHGRRGGGGGSTNGEQFARAKPVPAGQSSLFDIFDSPAPTPTPSTVIQKQPQSRVEVHAAEIRSMIDGVTAEAVSTGANLSPATKQRIAELADRVAKHADETNEMRKAALYDANGDYVATPEQRTAFRETLESRAAQIRTDIIDEANRLVAAEDAIAPNVGNHNAVFSSAGVLLRETMRNPDAVNVVLKEINRFPGSPDPLPWRSDAVSAIRDVEKYVHRAPNERDDIYLSGDTRDSRYLGWFTGGDPKPSEIYINRNSFTDANTPRNYASTSTVRTVAMHEYGHALDAAKKRSGAMSFTGEHVSEFYGNGYAAHIKKTHDAAAKLGYTDVAVDFVLPDGMKRSQMLIPYQSTVYYSVVDTSKPSQTANQTGPKRPKFVPQVNASEYTSTLLEKMHGNTGMKGSIFSYLIASQEPRNFDFVYALTQY